MKKEDRELLIKDLCARLPYNTMIHGVYAYNNPNYDCGKDPDKILYSEHDSVMLPSDIDWIEMYAADIKPYLFPLSSMTEEQKNEYTYIVNYINSDDTNNWKEGEFIYIEQFTQLMHFYHKHHIDYRGLISMGLAINATNLNIY